MFREIRSEVVHQPPVKRHRPGLPGLGCAGLPAALDLAFRPANGDGATMEVEVADLETRQLHRAQSRVRQEEHHQLVTLREHDHDRPHIRVLLGQLPRGLLGAELAEAVLAPFDLRIQLSQRAERVLHHRVVGAAPVPVEARFVGVEVAVTCQNVRSAHREAVEARRRR